LTTDYSKVIVDKPWGYEYLIFESDQVALWLLHIEKNQSTSLHCHPTKTTGFLILRGEVELSFIADSKKLIAPDKQMIRRGLFHKTKALTDDVFILEIETPNDKEDLVRLNDQYGRSSLGYEKEKEFRKREKDSIWINIPEKSKSKIFSNNEVNFEVQRLDDKSEFFKFNPNDIIMFLTGGLGKKVNNRRHLATIPGDIGYSRVINKVASEMEYVQDQTMILRVLCN